MKHDFLELKEEFEKMYLVGLNFSDLCIKINMFVISNSLTTKEKISLIKIILDKIRGKLNCSIDNNELFIILNLCNSILFTLQEKYILEMKLENVKNFC